MWDRKLLLVVDDMESKAYDPVTDPGPSSAFLGPFRIIFDSATTFHFLGSRCSDLAEPEFFVGEGRIVGCN